MTAQHFDVLIIGAGLSGIGTACQVTAEFPNKTIAVLERRERLGGTWDVMPRQGTKLPWKVLMHYEKDSKMLLEAPVEDDALEFGAPARVEAFA